MQMKQKNKYLKKFREKRIYVHPRFPSIITRLSRRQENTFVFPFFWFSNAFCLLSYSRLKETQTIKYCLLVCN